MTKVQIAKFNNKYDTAVLRLRDANAWVSAATQQMRECIEASFYNWSMEQAAKNLAKALEAARKANEVMQALDKQRDEAAANGIALATIWG